MSKLSFSAMPSQIEQIIDQIMTAPEVISVPVEMLFTLRLAVEELVANVVNYAYSNEEGNLDVDINLKDNQLSITFIDHGVPFNPLAQTDPDITLTAEEREIGGLGIFLVKQVMDSVEYYFVDGKNHTVIRKKLLINTPE